jgi:hypothetical protein
MSSLSYTVCADGVLVGGNTYGVREVLKGLGAVWLSESKEWLFPARCAEAVRGRVDQALAAAKKIRREELAAARAQKAWEASPEGRRARVTLALAAGTHTWICCSECEVLDWTRKTSDCGIHGFRLRGSAWDGT